MLPFAALAQWSDAAGLWQGQAGGSDPFQNFTYAATQGFPTPVGTAVTLMPFAHPYDAAMRAITLANATGQPSTIGYGPGAMSLQRGLLGARVATVVFVIVAAALCTTGLVLLKTTGETAYVLVAAVALGIVTTVCTWQVGRSRLSAPGADPAPR